MRLHQFAALALLLAPTVVPSIAQAHHGWSSYDSTKEFTLEAQLKSLRWANPHGGATLDWKGETWAVTLAPIARMESRGLKPEMLKPGTKVTLIGQPRADGTREMKIQQLILDGKTYNLMF